MTQSSRSFCVCSLCTHFTPPDKPFFWQSCHAAGFSFLPVWEAWTHHTGEEPSLWHLDKYSAGVYRWTSPLQILAQPMERNNFKTHRACSDKYLKTEQITTYSSLTILTTSWVTKMGAQCLDVKFGEMIPPMTPALKLLSTLKTKTKTNPHLVFLSLSRQDWLICCCICSRLSQS